MKCSINVPNRHYNMANWFIEKTKNAIDEQVKQLCIIEKLQDGEEKEDLHGSCIITLKYLCNMFFFMNGVEVNKEIIQGIITDKYAGLELFEVYCGIKGMTEWGINNYNFEKLNDTVGELISSNDRSNRTLIYDYISKNREDLYFCKKDIEKIIEILDEVTINNMEWKGATTLIEKILEDIKKREFDERV